MPEDEQLELIDAHPRLGAPPASVSAASFREQGYDRETTAAIADLERLNAAVRGAVRVPVLRLRRRPVAAGARAGARGGASTPIATPRSSGRSRDVVAIARDRFSAGRTTAEVAS